MRRRQNERSMRSELGSFVRSLLFLDLPHEEDYINGNLLMEYDQSSRNAEQSQDGRCCGNQTTMHNRVSNNQRSYSGSWVQSPRINRTYVPVYSVCKSHCKFYTNYNFDRTSHHIEHTCSLYVYVPTMYVRGRNVRACL